MHGGVARRCEPGCSAGTGVYGRRLTVAMAQSKLDDEHKLKTPVKRLEPGTTIKAGLVCVSLNAADPGFD